MKKLFILFFVFCLISTVKILAQEVEVPIPTPTTAGDYLNDKIHADSVNLKSNPNRVYVLDRGGKYLVSANITQPAGLPIRIRAAKGTGPKPMIFAIKTGTATTAPNMFNAKGSLYLKNLVVSSYVQSKTFATDTANIRDLATSIIGTAAAGYDIIIDSCVMVSAHSQVIRTDKAPRTVKITNTVWGDMGCLLKTNLGAGKGIDIRNGSCDTLLMQNNTFVNIQDRLVRHYQSTANLKYFVFDHNTLVNSMSYHGILSLGMIENSPIKITNNLFVDPFALGNDTDYVRQAEFKTADENTVGGNAKMYWIIATKPSDQAKMPSLKVNKNYYIITSAQQAWYDKVKASLTDKTVFNNEGTQMQYWLRKLVGADTLNAFTKLTGTTLTKTPGVMTAFLDWYRDPNGANKTKATTKWDIRKYDYNRKSVWFYTDTLNCSYGTTSPAYTGADGGFPAGDLNWYPSKKASWLTSVETKYVDVRPNGYSLDQNYPNPFNPATNICYSLPKASQVSLVVFNVLGQEVERLVNNQNQNAGRYTITWDASKYTSGVYFYKLKTDNFTVSKKMMLVK